MWIFLGRNQVKACIFLSGQHIVSRYKLEATQTAETWQIAKWKHSGDHQHFRGVQKNRVPGKETENEVRKAREAGEVGIMEVKGGNF